MEKPTLSLYLHIPFCRSKCRYCDFCSFPGMTETEIRRYAAALGAELRAGAAEAESYTVSTVFFGGGTPTLLPTDTISELAEIIRTRYPLSDDVEWTAEMNPATADEEKLRAMRRCGFNRLSVGMQSAHDAELALLGRAHRMKETEATWEAAAAAGFTERNLDLMFGIPGETPESFAVSLSRAIAMRPTHLSVYSLQIEEGTPFARERDSLPLPREEEEEEMAELLYRMTEEAGYRRYEISNFALPGHECRHNLTYWRMTDYRGFGIAAHSLMGSRRFYNGTSLSAFLENPLGVREEEETLTPAMREEETVMLGLRLTAGIGETEFSRAFGHGFFAAYGSRLTPLMQKGLVGRAGERTFLTPRGMALSTAVLAEILRD